MTLVMDAATADAMRRLQVLWLMDAVVVEFVQVELTARWTLNAHVDDIVRLIRPRHNDNIAERQIEWLEMEWGAVRDRKGDCLVERGRQQEHGTEQTFQTPPSDRRTSAS